MSRSYISPVMLLLFSFSIISFFLIVAPEANAGLAGACCGCDSGCTGGSSGRCDVRHPDSCTFALGMYQGDGTTCDPDPCSITTSGCEATIKCVCESFFHTRVVDCPTNFDSPPFFPSLGPPYTLGVDCSEPLLDSFHASCENLDIRCKWWYGEHKNCLLTLPLSVVPVPPPTPPPPY
jgi:hypothetical protein